MMKPGSTDVNASRPRSLRPEEGAHADNVSTRRHQALGPVAIVAGMALAGWRKSSQRQSGE